MIVINIYAAGKNEHAFNFFDVEDFLGYFKNETKIVIKEIPKLRNR